MRIGGDMVWRIFAWCLVAVVMSGCATATTGIDFESMLQNTGSPRAGQARIVVLREKSIALNIGWDVKLDGAPLNSLKAGTYIYADLAAGTHQLTADEALFPGTTRRDIAMQSGRTYFFIAKRSKRSDTLAVLGGVGGLAGIAVGAMATSGDDNPGPLDFVPLDAAAARTAMAELRLGS
jgi:hypothetical protein